MSGFPIQPAERWIVLRGDPAPLRAWLRCQAVAAPEGDGKEPPADHCPDTGRRSA